jgi:site-specific DNA-adenine methylase
LFRDYKQKQYDTNPDLVDFWANLKTGYDKFISDGKALSVQINEKGDYQF